MKLIKNGRVINPAADEDVVKDILIDGDTIVKTGRDLSADAEIIDAAGMIVAPGLIDVHVHFRDPGRTELETIAGGAALAAKGGYTTVCTMPNTTPPIDRPELVRYIIEQGKKTGINILPSACVTKGRAGEEIASLRELKLAGAVAFTDDGSPIMNAKLMRRALEECAGLGVPIYAHEEDASLAAGGVMNEGRVSEELGVQGIPRETEEIMIARDVLLSRLTGGHIHIQHLSSGGSVDIVRRAKSDGIRISAETAPHYFWLTDEAVKVHGANAKMSPSLRSDDDRRKVIEGLRDGTIDCIATDHAPHPESEKSRELPKTPNGIIGLETALPLSITKLVNEEGFTYLQLFRLMSLRPAQILGIDRGDISEGRKADLVIINPDKKVKITSDFLMSSYKNCPFIGMELYGSVVYTICSGKIAYAG